MAHPITLVTEKYPPELDKWRTATTNCDGTVIYVLSENVEDRLDTDREYSVFCKHEIVSGETRLFEWCDEGRSEKDRLVGMYSIADDQIVVVSNAESRNRLTQHMVQLHNGAITMKQPKGFDGWADTICTRTRTFAGRHSTICIRTGQVYSGRLLVHIEGGFRRGTQIRVHSIASNPLHIERYRDVNLSRKVLTLVELANSKELELWLPFPTKSGIFFLLREGPVEDFGGRRRFCTNMLGAIYSEENNEYTTRLVPLDDSEVTVNPSYLTKFDVFANNQCEGLGYLGFECPDDEMLKSRRWWWKEKIHPVNVLLSNTTNCCLQLFKCFVCCGDLTLRARRWQLRVEFECRSPTKNIVFCIDFENLKFRVVPFQKEKHSNGLEDPVRLFIMCAPNGALLVVSLPYHDEDSYEEFPSLLIVTLLWQPTNTPTLKEIAQRKVLHVMPEYRGAEVRERYGLLDYGSREERKEQRDAEDLISMDTSHYVKDVE